jgi:hypothetical protein
MFAKILQDVRGEILDTAKSDFSQVPVDIWLDSLDIQ